MALAAILDLGVKVTPKLFEYDLKRFCMPKIVENDTSFVIIAYPLHDISTFMFFNMALAAILDLGAKMTPKHFEYDLKMFGMPQIVENGTLFVFIVYPGHDI